MTYKTFDFHTIVYYEVANGATMDGIQLLDGDADNVDEIGVIIRVSGDWESASRDTPESSSRDIEVVGVELGWEGKFTANDLLADDVERIGRLLRSDLEKNEYNEDGVV